MTQMDTQNQATKHLQGQNVELEDDAQAGIGPWLRWAANICTAVVAVGTAFASPWATEWALAPRCMFASSVVLTPCRFSSVERRTSFGRGFRHSPAGHVELDLG